MIGDIEEVEVERMPCFLVKKMVGVIVGEKTAGNTKFFLSGTDTVNQGENPDKDG